MLKRCARIILFDRPILVVMVCAVLPMQRGMLQVIRLHQRKALTSVSEALPENRTQQKKGEPAFLHTLNRITRLGYPMYRIKLEIL